MDPQSPLSRRTVVTMVAAPPAAALLAGCVGDGDDEAVDDTNDDETAPVEAAVDIAGDRTSRVDISVSSADNAAQIVLVQDGTVADGMDAATGNAEQFTSSNPGTGRYEVWAVLGEDINVLDDAEGSLELDEFTIVIEPGTTIVLEGLTGGWEGVEPTAIAGEVNPTLFLQEGGDYEITWEQGDGGAHSINLWDENDEIVDGYATDVTADPDAGGLPLAFTATEEIETVRCEPHPNMSLNVEVE